FSCTSNPDKTSTESQMTSKESDISQNDTIIYTHIDSISLKNLKFLKAYFISYNENEGKVFASEKYQNYLEDYNKTNLNYTISNDTITVRIIYAVMYKGFKVIPTGIYETKDSIVLKQGTNVNSDSADLFKDKFRARE